jgi:hypothetical protein
VKGLNKKMDTLTTHDFKPTIEYIPLTREEIFTLKVARNKKLLYILSTYGMLSIVLVFAMIRGWGRAARYGEDELARVNKIGPYFFAFIFLLLTYYFIRYYFQSVHPYVKDLKEKQKKTIFFQPLRYKTPAFEEFFFTTPLEKKQLVRVSRADYEEFIAGDTFCFDTAPYSGYIFRLLKNEQKIEFS